MRQIVAERTLNTMKHPSLCGKPVVRQITMHTKNFGTVNAGVLANENDFSENLAHYRVPDCGILNARTTRFPGLDAANKGDNDFFEPFRDFFAIEVSEGHARPVLEGLDKESILAFAQDQSASDIGIRSAIALSLIIESFVNDEYAVVTWNLPFPFQSEMIEYVNAGGVFEGARFYSYIWKSQLHNMLIVPPDSLSALRDFFIVGSVPVEIVCSKLFYISAKRLSETVTLTSGEEAPTPVGCILLGAASDTKEKILEKAKRMMHGAFRPDSAFEPLFHGRNIFHLCAQGKYKDYLDKQMEIYAKKAIIKKAMAGEEFELNEETFSEIVNSAPSLLRKSLSGINFDKDTALLEDGMNGISAIYMPLGEFVKGLCGDCEDEEGSFTTTFSAAEANVFREKTFASAQSVIAQGIMEQLLQKNPMEGNL